MQKLAIVTGGSSGIGRHLVKSFANNGYAVAFNHMADAAAASEVVADIEASGGKALALESDVSVEAEVMKFYTKVGDWFGAGPDVLINNAGIQTWSSLLDLSEADWDNVLKTNLKGCFLHTKHAAKAMIASEKSGYIVNLGSGCNKLAFPKLVDYTASKGGIEQFTKVSAGELGPYGINVNCVAPGAILTERTLIEAPDYDEIWSKITPLRRVGTPEDIAGPVLFLCSEAASFISGQTIGIDGGVFSQAAWPHEAY
ncbi:MAG: SDR family oxidoreductase [Alphaproteobacteria bacterium]|nr:SDR family oxidoreductase [Alphaproteobacteria bacterium]